jgi:ubiquinone/menaquinone biosynthesis C-methylase UbiE
MPFQGILQEESRKLLKEEYALMYRLENRHWWFLAKRRFIKIVLDEFFEAKGEKILDIGCGTGGMMELLKRYGSVFGLDSHEEACALSCQRNSFPFLKGDANHLPFKRESFHLITLFDVLYHQFILDDQAVLAQTYDLLAPEGCLLITDSAFDSLKSTHDRAVMARHRYTLGELTGKMKKAGFSIIKKSYLYFSLFPLVVLTRGMGKLSTRSSGAEAHSDLKETNPAINRLLLAILGWEGWFLKRSALPWGSSLIILGQKK